MRVKYIYFWYVQGDCDKRLSSFTNLQCMKSNIEAYLRTFSRIPSDAMAILLTER